MRVQSMFLCLQFASDWGRGYSLHSLPTDRPSSWKQGRVTGNKVFILSGLIVTKYDVIMTSPAPRGHSAVVVVQHPLDTDHVAFGLLRQHLVVHSGKPHLLLVVAGLQLPEIVVE